MRCRDVADHELQCFERASCDTICQSVPVQVQYVEIAELALFAWSKVFFDFQAVEAHTSKQKSPSYLVT